VTGPEAPAASQRQEPWQPRLRPWDHAWRFATCLALSGLVWWEVAETQIRERPALLAVDVTLGVLAFTLLGWRRRAPLTIAVTLAALGSVSAWAAGASVLAAVSLATHRRWGPIVIVGLLSVVGSLVYPAVQPTAEDQLWVNLLAGAAFTVAILAVGMYVGSRRELLWTLRQRADRAEAEQALRAEQARLQERERIAREMHDVLGHRISLLAVHAGALAYRDDLDRDQVRASAEVISASAHQAMDDLRAVLGVLRDDGATVDLPQPTLADLPALVDEARASGMRVDLRQDLSGATTPTGRDGCPADAIGRTVYRIVQEGLTNARRHAPGALLRIEVTGGPDDGLALALHNPLPLVGERLPVPDGAGLGLVGLTERVALVGGWLRPQLDATGFTLRAWLPWSAHAGSGSP